MASTLGTSGEMPADARRSGAELGADLHRQGSVGHSGDRLVDRGWPVDERHWHGARVDFRN